MGKLSKENIKKEKENKISISKEKVALFLIILIQIIVYVFLGFQKTYIHMDEAYSIGLTNYDKVEITQNEDFYNNWHNKEYYEDYISISKEEALDLKPVYENQKNDVHPPFYYLLLRIAYSFNLDSFSKWPGLILNIIIMILSNILVYKILKEIIKDKKIILLICLVNGLTIATLESVLYIRMYALNALFLLLIAYIHLKNFRKEKIKISTYIIMGITVLLAALTHYYNVIYIGVIYLIYVIRYIKNKQYKNILKYTITMVVPAVIFLIVFPYAIEHIFMGYRGEGVLSTFTNPSKMLSNLGNYLNIVNTNIFNGMLWIVLTFFAFILIYKLVKNRKVTMKLENIKLLLITIPAIVYFIIVAVSSPYTEIRYIIPVCSFIFIYVIYLLNLMFNKILSERNSKIVFLVTMILILIMPVLTNIKINNLYIEHKQIVKEVEEKYSKLPTIYLFNTNQNRFLDDIYLFTKIEESYILDIEKANEESIDEILKNKNLDNGIILWVNEGFDKENYIEMIKNNNIKKFEKCEHLKRMNACDIYILGTPLF